MEAAFPSLLERTVASSLLLLSGLPPSLSPPPLSEPDSEESEKSLWLSNSKSCSSFFLDDCSVRNTGLHKSKSSSYFAILDNASEKREGLSNPKWSSCLSIIDDDPENSVGLSNSKTSSCLSSLTRDDGSSLETCAHRLRMVAVVSRSHEMKLKVGRRSRTEIMRTSNHQKRKICVEKTKTELSATSAAEAASSCLSSGSSGGGMVVSSGLKPKPKVNSASIRSRAEGIMRVLSYGCASEVRIRQLLGDSPDTSKALRMLLKKEQIRRSGIGGRWDPFIYKIA